MITIFKGSSFGLNHTLRKRNVYPFPVYASLLELIASFEQQR